MKVLMYDTTLRDGSQRAGVSLSLDDKLAIAKLLDGFGMDYIEGGWPASNPKDTQFFRLAKSQLGQSRLAAFGSTCRRGVAAPDDGNLRALVESGVEVVTIFGKASRFQATRILEVDEAENLRMVEDSVRFLVGQGLEVIFDAEHFFDGARGGDDYPFAVLERAARAGAAWLVLCDTNGGSLPYDVGPLVRKAASLGVPIGIHAHNDGGLAVANTLEAVRAGAAMVQGTINGYGERCGNVDLCSVLPNLVLKMGAQAASGDRLSQLTHLSRAVSEIANLVPDGSAPFVGENAFTHKGGVHVGAVRKYPEAYEHVPPEAVGQERRILVSELAGRSNLLYHFEDLKMGREELGRVMEDVKRLEAEGYQFEAAESSVALMVHRALGQVPTFYEVERFHVSVMFDREPVTEATVRVKVGGRGVLEVGDGDGPVNALDNALRKALTRFYPVLGELRLTDYKVRVLDQKAATAAQVRVHVRSEFRGQAVNTVGVSANILEASWKALLDAVDYALWTSSKAASQQAERTTS